MIRPSGEGERPDAAWFAATVACRAACPVNTDAAGYVQAIADGRVTDAYDLARAHNPFPSVCGRVCSAPCEKACRRGVIDTAIAIRALKRVACEAFAHGNDRVQRWHRAHGVVPAATRRSVGIVGAGPAGLAAAHDLRLAGHAVTLYDAESEPGGLLLWGIPAFRLSRDVVRDEIAAVLSLGIEFVGNTRIGTDRSITTLLDRHAAVLLTHGCSLGRTLAVPGASLANVFTALAFLDDFNHQRLSTVLSPVVVIGGGSVAFDAARAARRLGARADAPATPVVLLAPEPLCRLPVPEDELHEATAEGVIIRAGMGVRELCGTERVDAVRAAPVVTLRDADGRFNPVLQAGGDEIVQAATVIFAVGQRADATVLGDARDRLTASWGGVPTPARDGRTAEVNLYAAGDVTSGPGDLIDAIASGQRAAASMIADLRDAVAPRMTAPRDEAAVVATPLAMNRRYWSGYDTIPRRALPVLPIGERRLHAEVEATLVPDAARLEASRCLLCDTHIMLDAPRCIGCALCVDVCPYGCIALAVTERAEDGTPETFSLTLDETACIRCGLCIDRCPPHALDLVRV